jgi:hypothetical protein
MAAFGAFGNSSHGYRAQPLSRARMRGNDDGIIVNQRDDRNERKPRRRSADNSDRRPRKGPPRARGRAGTSRSRDRDADTDDDKPRRGRRTRGQGRGQGRGEGSGEGRGARDQDRSRARDRGRDASKPRRSRSSDDRNPTRSGTQYPPKRYRSRHPEEEVPSKPGRPALRTVKKGAAPTKERPATTRRRATPVRRRRGRAGEAMEELARLAGRNARRAQDQLAQAAEAFGAGRERDAAKLLRPLRDAYPDASAVRELLGLTHYRLGQYPAAAKELEAFVDISDSVEQHPVLMDCYRAARRYDRIDALWQELAAASPAAALVTEGRIVYAGALADRGRMKEAVAVLEKRAADVKRVQEHHLRLWYALADLYERAGDIPRARDLFERIRRRDNAFADVAERLLALG